MNQLWQDKIRKVIPYVPGDQPKVTNLIKLNTNENPYPPSPKVLEALRNFDVEKLRLYPELEPTGFLEALSDYYGIRKEQIFIGNGSDEVLALAFLTYFNSEQPLLFPNITYSFYPVYAELYDIKYKRIPLDENFEINPGDYKVPNGGIIFANPNAPTSIGAPLATVEDIIQANQDVVVIIDEAYVDFGGESAVELINKYDNVLVIQTFSKSRALAGLRMGLALGSKELIQHLENVKNSFNSYPIDSIAKVLAEAAIKDVDYFKEITEKVIKTREFVISELRGMGFVLPDSKANFVFVSHPEISAKALYEFLKEHNIFVRYFSSPLIDNHLRITIGTDEEMNILLKHIRLFLDKR
jgi:histidinol-phosphate aminotransferase